jgi:hypothetical protein
VGRSNSSVAASSRLRRAGDDFAATESLRVAEAGAFTGPSPQVSLGLGPAIITGHGGGDEAVPLND